MRYSIRRPLSVAIATVVSIGGLAGLTPTASAAAGVAVQTAVADGPRQRVIVQLDEPAALRQIGKPGQSLDATNRAAMQTLGQTRADVRAEQRDMIASARVAGLEVQQTDSFTDLIDAVAVTVPASDIDDLRTLPNVRAVYPDEPVRAMTDVSVPLVGAPEVWEQTDADGRPVRGEGVTVAVIDTGIDYSHPDLGGGFGPGHKVVGGYDFVNGDADPMDDNGHGTHVAGIIAGDGGVTGVAPAASLTAYKVLDDNGGGWDSDIIAALETAVAPDNPYQADVVNLSLGGPGDGTDPLGQAATAAAREGAVVVASAGNSGPAAGTVGSPAAADGVISVGASISGLRVPVAYIESPTHELIQAYRASYSANPPEESVAGELVDVGRGTSEDYDRVGDVAGKVVAVEMSIPGSPEQTSSWFIEQARMAEDRGAIALIGYERSGGGPVLASPDPNAAAGQPEDLAGVIDVPLHSAESGDSFRMDSLVVLGVEELQWQELAGYLGKGSVEISITGEDVTDRVAAFSSQGPTGRFTLEPDIVAPGVEIRSTWPKAQWEPGEFRLSGTSMSAPHVAGAAALLRQLRPDDTATDTGAALVGSAKALDDLGPTAQGAGRLDVAAAAATTVTAAPATLSLGLADMSGDTVGAGGTVQLHNHADHPVDLTLSGRLAPDSPGTVHVTPENVTIPAGGETAVTVRVSAETPTTDTDLAGWVEAQIEGAPDVRVPYLLAVRPLLVRSSPDPSDGTSEAFVYSPTALAQPPVLTVTPPEGKPTTVTMTHDHGTWYRADVTGNLAGAYRLDVRARATGGEGLAGAGAFEVLPKDNQRGRDRWEPVGPNGQAGWITTTPADPDTAVVNQGGKLGPWVTQDGGESWQQLQRMPVAGGSGTVIVDAHDPDRMWYAVNGTAGSAFSVLLDPTYQGKVLRTDNGGRTWRVLDFPDTQVGAFVSDSATQVLVALTADALVVSRDAGRTWTSYPSPVPTDELTDAVMGGRDLYLASFDRVWAVRDIVGGAPAAVEQVYDAGDGYLRGVVADDQLVAVLTNDNRLEGSRDGGRTWQTLHQFPQFGPWSLMLRGGTLVVGTYRDEGYVSRDYGATWTTIQRPLRAAIESDFTPWTDGSLLFASEDAGLFRTDADGANPHRIGVQGVNAYDLAVSTGPDGTPILIAGTDADTYRTALPVAQQVTPSMAEWGLSGFEAYVGTKVAQVEASPSEPGVVWKVRKDALDDFWVYRSDDGGATWDLRGRTFEAPLGLAVSPVDPDRVVVPFWSLVGIGLYATRDGGESWKKLFHDQLFTAVAADPTDPDRLWLGSASGLYRSDDFGATLTKVTSGRVDAITVDGRRIVVGGDRIRVSTDGGQTFHAADTGGLPMRVSDLVASPTNPDTLYAATTSYSANGLVKGGRGVLRSTDGGQTWVNVSGGLQNLSVQSLVVSPDGHWLFAGTNQGGVHRLRID